jgi:hypothetical protein
MGINTYFNFKQNDGTIEMTWPIKNNSINYDSNYNL